MFSEDMHKTKAFKILTEFADKIADCIISLEENTNKEIVMHQPSGKFKGSSIFGSSNLGNTCFFNSAMQCMNASRAMVEQYIENHSRFSKYDDLLSSKIIKF